jgi:hypothetical protein
MRQSPRWLDCVRPAGASKASARFGVGRLSDSSLSTRQELAFDQGLAESAKTENDKCMFKKLIIVAARALRIGKDLFHAAD